MKSIRTLTLMSLLAVAPRAYAGPYEAPTMAPAPTYAAPTVEVFGPGFNFGAHALFLTPDSDRADDVWGGGLNADYFLNPYLGFQAAAAWADPGTDEIWHNYTLDLVLRAPLQSIRVAPYVFAGGGAILEDDAEILGRAGVGLEFRPVDTFGIFADWVYNFPGDSGNEEDLEDYQMIRIGVKFGF